MPVSPTYPGVYIEELPSGVRTIVGVATSIAAFIDYFARGPIDYPVEVFNFTDVERELGGLNRDSAASYALRQFFLNGGSQAYVVRTAGGTPAPASIVMQDGARADALTATAGRRMGRDTVDDPGAWGNDLRLDVDYDVDLTRSDAADLFNLTVAEIEVSDGTTRILQSYAYRNLSVDPSSPDDMIESVNVASKLVQLSASSGARPAQTGTVGIAVDEATVLGAVANGNTLSVNHGTATAVATLAFTTGPATIQDVRAALQAAIRAANTADPLLTGAVVALQRESPTSSNWRFRVLAGRTGAGYDPETVLTFSESGGTTAADLGLLTGTAGLTENVQQYVLGGTTGAGFQGTSVVGADGTVPGAAQLLGVRNDKTGLYALEDVDLFNILCIPRAAELGSTDLSAVVSEAAAYCLERRAFYIVDLPTTVTDRQGALDWIDQNGSLRSRNAAAYFPRPRVPDPLNGYRLRSLAPSGTVAGIYARTDAGRGVWKAPGGTEATLTNVQELEYALTDAENGALNPLGVNCLRTFNVYGNLCWGARTLDGADVLASEWKYVPIRRLALYLEESLYRGTKGVVFEPNDEPLWSQIRLNVGAFMHNLFRQGAFQGTSPKNAYFVRCDSETTTENDRDLGIVNVVVGFAPLKPAEFVIIKIQQIAGEIQT